MVPHAGAACLLSLHRGHACVRLDRHCQDNDGAHGRRLLAEIECPEVESLADKGLPKTALPRRWGSIVDPRAGDSAPAGVEVLKHACLPGVAGTSAPPAWLWSTGRLLSAQRDRLSWGHAARISPADGLYQTI